MNVGNFIGRRAADVVNFFRGRQAVPCTVDWDEWEPPVDPADDEYGSFRRARERAMISAELNGMQEVKGVTGISFNFAEEEPPVIIDHNAQRAEFARNDDDCGICGGDCCLATDTIRELRGDD